jgi:hypothetical protein
MKSRRPEGTMENCRCHAKSKAARDGRADRRAGRKQRPHASGSDFAKEGGRFSRDKKIATALAQCRLLALSF